MLRKLTSIPGDIELLASKGKTRSKNWTLAQVADHLAMAIEWQIGLIPEGMLPARLPPMWVRRVFRCVFLGIGRLPANVPANESILPQEDVALPASIARLRNAIKLMHEFAGPFRTHPFFGNMSLAGWVRFHEVHAAHHLRNVM